MKYYQGLEPEDKLYDLLIDMEPKSYVKAQEVTRRYSQNMALKANMVEARPKGQGHGMNSMSEGPRSKSQSPRKGKEKKQRGRLFPKQKKQQILKQQKTLLELRENFRPLGGLMPQGTKRQEG